MAGPLVLHEQESASFNAVFDTKYPRMDQVKFEEDSLEGIWSALTECLWSVFHSLFGSILAYFDSFIEL